MQLKRDDSQMNDQTGFNQQPGYGQQSPFGQQMNNQGGFNQQTSYYNQQSGYAQQNPYGGQPDPYQQSAYNQPDPYQQNPYNQPDAFSSAQNQQGYYDAAFAETTGGNPYYSNGMDNSGSTASQFGVAIDITSVLSKTFIYMFIALLVTGITSLLVATSPSMMAIFWGAGTAPFIICAIVEFVLVIACSTAIKRNDLVLSAVLFFVFAVVNGLTLSVIFLAFQLQSIVNVFFMTAIVFGVMAFLGAVTKKDLTKLGPILFAGLIGIILGSIVNMFIGSSAADFALTIIGIMVFTLFTAYDVNKILKMSRSRVGLSDNVIALYGAMELYLDFINLFLRLLRLFGKRR